MPYQSSYTVCDDALEEHYDRDCTDTPEHARIRRGAWIHTSVVDAIVADVENADVWTDQIEAGKVIILPELSGSFDGGTPEVGPGYGYNLSQYFYSKFKATIKDPLYRKNYLHYRSLAYSDAWHLAYLTEGLLHITGNPVTVLSRNPITENTDDVVVWENDVSWFEDFTPQPFTPPAGIFNLANPLTQQLEILFDSNGNAIVDTDGGSVFLLK